MRHIDEIIIHCTATPADWRKGQPTSEKVAEVRRLHVNGNGWSDIGYHYLIDRDGTVAEGRPEERTGAHVKGHNTGTIGITLFGGHGGSENDKFEEHFTPKQDAALRRLIADLEEKHQIKKVTGHNEYAAKACPCFKVRDWLNKKSPRTMAGSTTLQASGLSAAGVATTAAAALGELDGTAQLVAIGALVVVGLGLVWIARERVKKWAKGVR